jgi:methyltransferase (TIGR00027 family)
MMTPVGLTSRWVAASRALETEALAPLFSEPLARALAGEEGFSLLDASARARPGATAGVPDPYLSVRTRYFDDALLAVANEPNLRQVVILAAGMDARAFRLPWPDGTALFEVDRDDVFDHKEPILRKSSASPRCQRHVVRADLLPLRGARDWAGHLARAGFDRQRPAAFLAEGLLPYLPPEAVSSLFTTISALTQPGSWLGLDAVSAEMLTSPYLQPFLEMLDRFGCPWRFGTSSPEQLLEAHGWTATAVQPGEPSANFGRWPYPVVPRSVPGVPRSFFVTARRSG